MDTLGLAADQLPPDDAPPLDLTGREQSIRDIVFARTIGYRPWQMDLFLPAPAAPPRSARRAPVARRNPCCQA